MRIRMLTIMAGPDGIVHPGQEVDLAPERARELIDGGFAEAIARPEPEKAVKPKPETAAGPKVKKDVPRSI